MLCEKYYNKLKEQGLNIAVCNSLSEEMIVKKLQDGWCEWKYVEFHNVKKIITEIENTYNILLPKNYIDTFFKYQFLSVEINEYTLFCFNEKVSWKSIYNMFDEVMIKEGIIPIGQINDEDFIAFNINNNQVLLIQYDNLNIEKTIFDILEDFLLFLENKL